MTPPSEDALLHAALRAAQDAAQEPTPLDLGLMCTEVHRLVIERLPPPRRWQWLAAGLMSARPSGFFLALRACGALKRLLPELEALFGVPQLCDEAEPVDVGEHQLRVLDECALAGLPLEVRFAALAHKIGKGGTPPEIWPSHYKHEQRAHALLDALAQRLAVPEEGLALARLVIDEADRVHRASDLRPGAIAALFERTQALARPQRFLSLLQVCRCDYAAYPGHDITDYPKAPRLERALRACAAAPVQGLDDEAALALRAEAIARSSMAAQPSGAMVASLLQAALGPSRVGGGATR